MSSSERAQLQTGASTYTVEITDISPIVEHAKEINSRGTSPKHDWDTRADVRSDTKTVNDRLKGKIGELAFARFIERNFGINATIDLEVYDSISETDYADLKTIGGKKPACQFDVKTTKQWNKWLSVRESIWKGHDEDDPFILTLINPNEVHVDADKINVTIVGWVEKENLSARIPRGERLHDPNTGEKIGPPMKTDNRGIPIEFIPRRTLPEWEEFVKNRLLRD